MLISITYSKVGFPCLTECGGSYTNTGSARIIADKNGYPKRAIKVFDHGDLACGDHAVIPVQVGDVVITADRHHDKVTLAVERIVSIDGDTANTAPVTEAICWDAVDAAVAKAYDYHCRRPYYIRKDSPGLNQTRATITGNDDLEPELEFEEDYL